jgi:putative Mn2+ efflux pump MntP
MAALSVDNWLAITGIAVAMVAPVGQVLLQRRMEQRDQEVRESETQQAHPRMMAIWKRHAIRTVLYALPIGALMLEIFSTAAITRLSVLTISTCVASIFTMYLSQRLTNVMGRMLMLQDEHLEVTSKLARVARMPPDEPLSGNKRASKTPSHARQRRK